MQYKDGEIIEYKDFKTRCKEVRKLDRALSGWRIEILDKRHIRLHKKDVRA